MQTAEPRGQDPLDPATFAIDGVLGRLLAAGHHVTYAEDPVWPGSWFADLRDAKGRCTETGSGATRAAALADLRARAERSEPAAVALAAAAADDAREDLTAEDRTAMIEVMTAHEWSVLLSFVAGYAPGVFDRAVASRSGPSADVTFADELWNRIDKRLAEEEADAPQGYCTVCGSNVGWFLSYTGPQHYRGEGTVDSPVELLELDHEPVVAWRYPDGAQ